jgi:hypothetical protein
VAAEVNMVIQYLNANGLKKKKVVFCPNGLPTDKTFAQEYFTGKKQLFYKLCVGDEIHYQILTNAKEILLIIKTINKIFNIGNLTKIEESIRLCLVMCQA